MKSDTPKVLHQVAGRSMLAHVLAASPRPESTASPSLSGPGRDDVRGEARRLAPGADLRPGAATRHGACGAVGARRDRDGYDDLLILFADTPLVTAGDYRAPCARALAARRRRRGARVHGGRSFRLWPSAPGRRRPPGRDSRGKGRERDRAGDRLCNAGLMALDGAGRLALLERRQRQRQGRILSDRRRRARARRRARRRASSLADETEVLGVNDRVQLAPGRGRGPGAAAPRGHGRRRDPDRAGDGVSLLRHANSAATS